MAILGNGIEVGNLETSIRCCDGQTKVIAWSSRRVVNDSGDIGSIAIGQDVTDRKRMERDPLTGLYNRHKMEVLERTELLRAQCHQRPLALLWIDIDHFKQM